MTTIKSIEEKAKAYDEAIEKGKQIQNTPYTAHWDIMKEVAEHLLPSLKESEDERIRKEMIEFFTFEHWDGEAPFSYESAKERVAWLEKQGEQKHVEKVEPKFHEGDMIIHKELGGDYIHNPHKIIQVDILDKKYLLEGGLVTHFCEQDDYELVEQKPADTENGAKGNDREIPNSAWSEEDENRVNRLIAYFEDKESFTAEDDIVYANWLKSLKGIVQPQKQEWSEGDEHNLNSVINLVHNTRDGAWGSCVGERIESWLKSLKDRYTWKPSDEQIYALRSVVTELKHGDNKYQETIEDLYNDLKRLREE